MQKPVSKLGVRDTSVKGFLDFPLSLLVKLQSSTARLKRDGTRAETRFRLSAKRTSPF